MNTNAKHVPDHNLLLIIITNYQLAKIGRRQRPSFRPILICLIIYNMFTALSYCVSVSFARTMFVNIFTRWENCDWAYSRVGGSSAGGSSGGAHWLVRTKPKITIENDRIMDEIYHSYRRNFIGQKIVIILR